MKLPTKISIGPHTFKVITSYDFKDSRDAAGMCDMSALEIRISDRNQATLYPDSKILEIYYHEMLHAINHVYLPTEDQLTESQIEQIATGLLDTIKRNKFPQLLPY